MNEIIKDGIILARHIKKEDIKDGLNFYSNSNEYIQVGIWKYDAKKNLAAHIHNEVLREVKKTYEVLYVISGAVSADIYDINGNKTETLIVKQGEILLLLESGHGYNILNDETVVLEVKNGPYLGAEIDRTRI